MRARAHAAHEVGERGRERYEYARGGGDVLNSAAPSLARVSLESAISPVLTTDREHTDRKWLAVAGNPHVRLYRC